MVEAKTLLSDLQKLLTQLEDDIRRRCEAQSEVDSPLRAQYDAARTAGRTAQAYEVWRDDQITQAAVAWILGCVFVRFCEDNHLVDPPRLSGPGDRRQRAEDEHTLYFQRHPTHSDREYLLWVFDEVAKLPAMKELFDHKHNPLWSIQVSGDGAMALRGFFLRRDPATGLLVHDFSDPAFEGGGETSKTDLGSAGGDPTRFLGDLYQDLSESARKKFALLQTPIFVEEFILDRTLEPAIREFGFQQVRMIDPTCGSGHFLLGGFRRLFDLWVKHEPAANVRKLAQNALDAVVGVDLNPYAVAIARFRLFVAALGACGIARLADAPAFTIHLAAGDSLLHGPRPDVTGGRQQYLLGDDPLGHVYDVEDAPRLRQYLGRQYHAVVGNPPYITSKDKALNDAYRDRFGSCHRQYSLAVPFFERFFDLACNGESSGFVGMITANSFMKREFGKKLIEQYIPRWDLTHVIDTSLAYIPGHGTPTVILFGRNRRPRTSTIRAVMAINRENEQPADAARGQVWSAILAQIDCPGSQSYFVSVADTDRQSFYRHPWSIGGGGAAELKVHLENLNPKTLAGAVADVGVGAVTREDDAYMVSAPVARLRRIPEVQIKPLVEGDVIRDWSIVDPETGLWPYDPETLAPRASIELYQYLWPLRRVLSERVAFGLTQIERGLEWYEYSMFFRNRLKPILTLAFVLVATQNQFALDRGGKVFKHSAPALLRVHSLGTSL